MKIQKKTTAIIIAIATSFYLLGNLIGYRHATNQMFKEGPSLSPLINGQDSTPTIFDVAYDSMKQKFTVRINVLNKHGDIEKQGFMWRPGDDYIRFYKRGEHTSSAGTFPVIAGNNFIGNQ
jgi:hypothetical protein